MAGWNHNNAHWTPKDCKFCGATFTPNSGAHTFCSDKCRARWRMHNVNDTEMQYRQISGNWDRYFSRLCQRKVRKGVISPQDCRRILDRQKGLCALSGETLTCQLKRGEATLTNASLDRIDPKGSYAPDNVQLICVVLNSFRNDTPLNEFVGWCKKVAAYAVQEP